VAMGSQSSSRGEGAIAIGGSSSANGTGALAFGYNSTAEGTNAIAIGAGARATASGAIAIGPNAIADEVDLIALGSAINRVRAPGIASAASRAAQEGALSLVTTDEFGNLATSTLDISQLGALDGRLNLLNTRTTALEQAVAYNQRQANGGIAAAMAMSGTMIVPDSDWSMSFNLSTYNGAQGFSTSIVGKVTDRIYVSGAISGSTVENTTGGRVGVAIGF